MGGKRNPWQQQLWQAFVRQGLAFTLGGLLVALAYPAPVLAQQANLMNSWDGELLKKKQSAFYLRLRFDGFARAAQPSGSVKITLTNILRRQKYQFSYQIRLGGIRARLQKWKLPSGKYRVNEIALADGRGQIRKFSGGRKQLIMKRLHLANLGSWVVKPKGKDGLDVDFRMTKNVYEPDSGVEDSGLVAVINGFSGLVQQRMQGKSALEQAETDFGTQRQLRATATITRQIAMFYKLDLFKHNRYAQDVSTVLSVYDPNLRKCYTDRLLYRDRLKGEVKFTFILSKNSGTMVKLKHSGGSLKDPKMIECLYYELAAISFAPDETMVGELVYTFDVI